MICALAALGACREPFTIISGANPRAATRARAIQLFSSLGARITDPVRDQKYDSARVEIAQAAMLPSRVWNDTSVWTSGSTSRRTLLIAGRFAPPRYRLETARTVPNPKLPAESRHIINLTRLSDDTYAWDTEVMYALGNVPASDVSAFTRALFASGEGRDERDVRADYRAVAPRTTAALGMLFAVDTIRTARLADSSTLTTFTVTMHPSGVAARFPHFATYWRKYIQTLRMRWTLTDRNGAGYVDLSAWDGRILLRVRTRAGAMVSLLGPGRPMPDSLTLNGELAMKVRRFTAGFRDYHAEFTNIRTEHEASWSIVSRREPEWVLPSITERLLRTPLRRPFQGGGAMFRIGVRDSVGGQSILLRRLHFEVQESAILRFIGRLGAIAVGDYQGLAERDQNAWLREVFAGIVADIAAFTQ